MTDALPVVTVWRDTGTAWALAGQVATFDTLTFEPRHLDPGTWSMTMPYDGQATAITRDRLVAVDWRGVRSTWCVESFVPSSDANGQPILTVGGPGALSVVGRALAWPNPTAAIGSQPTAGDYAGPTETVLHDLIAQNLRDRYGARVTVAASAGRGTVLTAVRPRFDNLLELVEKKGRFGGVGVSAGLVSTSGTRADLRVGFYVPVDKSGRVRLSARSGTLRQWTQTETAPTVTSVLVGGAGSGTGRVFRQVTTTDSVASATAWGGHREVFVDDSGSSDAAELDQAGQTALKAGVDTTTLALVAGEAEGLKAFRDYAPGDTATGEVLTGVSVTDVITAITVSVSSTGIDVTPVFGDPNTTAPPMAQAAMIRALRRRIRNLESGR
ncbi:MAG: Gp37-like protein [Nocardioidaceae bacterium]